MASAFVALVVVVLVLLAVQGYRAGTTLTGTFLAGTILFGTALVSTTLTGTTLAGTFVDTTLTGTTLVGTIQASLIGRAPAGLGAQPSLWAVRPCRRCIGVATAAFRGCASVLRAEFAFAVAIIALLMQLLSLLPWSDRVIAVIATLLL